MSRLFFGVLVLVIAAQAVASTASIETFNGSWKSGPIGPMPNNWTFFGFGPPAYNTRETGIVLPPNDGVNSAWRIDVPGSVNTNGTIAIYQTNVYLDNLTLAGETIDWTKPVYLKADVFGQDLGWDTMFKTTLDMQGYTRTDGIAEWGTDGVGNTHWQTLSTTIDPGQAGKKGNLILFLDFNFTGKAFEGNSTVIWENVRMEYTPTPEPASLLLVGGLVGLGLLRRPRRA